VRRAHTPPRLSLTVTRTHVGMSHLSTSLRTESEKYRKAARNINVQAMFRQYAPVAAVVLILIILLYWRFS
jgi:vesicle transport protein SEC22